MPSQAVELLTVRIGGDIDEALLSMQQVGAGARNLSRDIQGQQTVFGRLNAELTKSRSLMGLVAGATGAGLLTKSMFDIGAAVAETGSKFQTVFGESTDDVQRFIDHFGTLAGLSNQQAQEVLATTGAIVQGMGFAESASAKYATEVVKLAGDLSSFNNIPIEETSRAIQAAITGEREQLKRYGIVILEADVQKRALLNTGKKLSSSLTQEEKATATLQLITERAGVAVGDLERTQTSAANQARQLGAELLNLRDSMAEAVLPAMSVGVEGLNAFIHGLEIMGAESAVAVAKVELEFAKLKENGGLKGKLIDILGLDAGPGFGGAGLLDPLGLDLFSRAVGANLDMSVSEAERNLERVSAAADAVKLDIVGLSDSLSGDGGGGSPASGGGGLVPALDAVGRRAVDAGGFLEHDFTEGLKAAGKAAKDMHSVFIDGGTVAEAQRVFEQTRTPLEKFNARMRQLNALLASGAISVDTYERAVSQLKGDFTVLSEAQGVFVDDVVGGFDEITARTASVADAFHDMIQSIIRDLGRAELRKGLEALLLGTGEGGWGDVAKGVGLGLFSGFFADGGTIPAGHFGLVGERGPELVSGPARVMPTTMGPQVVHHQTVQLILNAVDGRDAAMFLEQNKGTIARLMLEVQRDL